MTEEQTERFWVLFMKAELTPEEEAEFGVLKAENEATG